MRKKLLARRAWLCYNCGVFDGKDVSMYAAERRRQILAAIRDRSSVQVAELAARFDVSPSTIRRDLNELHKADLVARTYGGAVTSLLSAPEAPFLERGMSRRAEKERIGEHAAALVRPGMTVILDGGTTTECLARHLRDVQGVTVATFGLNIVEALAGAETVTLITIGGLLQHRTRLFGGVLALDALAAYNLHFDLAFIAATGVSATEGITNFGFEEIPLKRRAIELSREVVLLADSSKVGVRAVGFIAPISHVHRLVTDQAAPEDQMAALRDVGVIVDLV
jgi:DeoR/GlpR family transcriptional regulator of sugar metabolism